MNEGKTNKIKLIKILEILRQETDEEHYMESSELIQKLGKMGVKVDRRTLAKDIELLNEFGYEIIVEKTTGFATKYGIADRLFDLPEVHILLDSVQSAAFITEEKTKTLVDKISTLAGRKQGEVMKHNIVEFTTAKSPNEKIYYSVSEISRAIVNRKKIKFNYFEYDVNYEKSFKLNRQGEKRGYKLNPLGTVFDNGYYYLFCYDDFFGKVSHYRVDKMEGVTMTEVDMTPGVEKEIENLPTRKRQLFAMYGGEVAMVEVQVDKDLIGVIFDKFGDHVQLQELDERWLKFIAEVQVSPTFIAWCCSFGGKIKINYPEWVVSSVKDYITQLYDTYN